MNGATGDTAEGDPPNQTAQVGKPSSRGDAVCAAAGASAVASASPAVEAAGASPPAAGAASDAAIPAASSRHRPRHPKPKRRFGVLERFDRLKRRGRQYSIGEEIGNAISHGIGAGLAIAALVLLIVFSVIGGGGLKLCSAVMFGVGLLLEYLFSTLYHAIQPPRAKVVLRVFDHSAIYVLIAGTYSPFLLVTLADHGGIPMCVAMWAVALLGIGVEVAARERQPKWVSALVYLVMGWVIVFRLPTLVGLLPAGGLWLLLAGGISYSVGVVFYLLKKVPFMHMVWHLFVLGGSICHFLAVLLFVY